MIRRIVSYMGSYKKYAILAIVCITAETTMELLIPFVMANIVDIGVANGDTGYIFEQGALMAACALVSMVLGMGSARFSATCGQGLGAELRKAEYKKIQGFSFANIDRFRTSSLITRLTGDVTTIQNSVSTGLRPAVRAPVMMITALAASFFMNPQLAVVFFIAVPVLAILLWLIIARVRPVYGQVQGAVDQVNRIIQENLIAIRVVKSYVRHDYEIDKFTAVNEDLKGTSVRAFSLTALNAPAMQLVMYSTIIAILWYGGRLTMVGNMAIGALVGFLSYVLQVLNSLMMISNVLQMLTRSLASGKRIMEVMDEEIDITPPTEGTTALVASGDIRFDHVYFKYKQDAQNYVLSDVSFHIASGQTVGIIGETGAAKSSLVQLIPRLYDASSGAVLVDGRNIKEYAPEHLRQAIAIVLQKNTLFSGTVEENLRWGKQDATDEEIRKACWIACVDEFIGRLENGYSTELGQGGVNVSGGQKQRLCIARALLKHPRILILDDATSAVDTATEAKIRARIQNELYGTTKILISQRVSSVEDADQIIILKDGRIDAIGSHETLLHDNAFYQELYASQKNGALR